MPEIESGRNFVQILFYFCIFEPDSPYFFLFSKKDSQPDEGMSSDT